MVYDKDVKQIFKDSEHFLAKYKSAESQCYRGIGPQAWEDQHPGVCQRHMSVFLKYNVIPEYCFDCYKVYIEPRTVLELFKLMVVFEKIKLPDDNTRKCMVELREEVSGSYKGFVYCRHLDQGEKVLEKVKKTVSKEISKKIPVSLKRGCSEYGLAYPEYTRIEKQNAMMKYKKEWKKYEDFIDQDLVINPAITPNGTYNHPGYSEYDAQVMLTWLRYAATIGDSSYLKISDRTLEPFQNIKRPHPFNINGDRKKSK